MITEEQRAARRLGVGGSDMPVIMGLSSYSTPYQLYMEKLGIIENSKPETPQQRWGNLLEDVIRHEFATLNNVTVETPETIVHPFYPFMRANMDGWIKEENAVLEIKTANGWMAQEWGETGTDVIPMQYLVQVVHYVACTNAVGAYIAVLIGGSDYRTFFYKRDLQLEEMVIEAAGKFWGCVQNYKAPEPVIIADLNLMFARHNPETTITVNPEIMIHIESLREINQQIKTLEKNQEKLKFDIMRYMKANESLVCEEGKIIATWKENARGSKTFLLKGK